VAFTPLKKILEGVLKEQDFVGDPEAYKVFLQWGEIVGRKVAAHTQPARLANKVL
jgi:predicted nucleic acid-binding Zn ribbon protein